MNDWEPEALWSDGRSFLEATFSHILNKRATMSSNTIDATASPTPSTSNTPSATPASTPNAATGATAGPAQSWLFVQREQVFKWVIECATEMHTCMLRDQCRQLPFVGDWNEEITLMDVKLVDKKKDVMKATPTKLPNRPYSKSILLEHLRYI